MGLVSSAVRFTASELVTRCRRKTIIHTLCHPAAGPIFLYRLPCLAGSRQKRVRSTSPKRWLRLFRALHVFPMGFCSDRLCSIPAPFQCSPQKGCGPKEGQGGPTTWCLPPRIFSGAVRWWTILAEPTLPPRETGQMAMKDLPFRHEGLSVALRTVNATVTDPTGFTGILWRQACNLPKSPCCGFDHCLTPEQGLGRMCRHTTLISMTDRYTTQRVFSSKTLPEPPRAIR